MIGRVWQTAAALVSLETNVQAEKRYL